MHKILLFLFLFYCSSNIYAQKNGEKIAMVIDSILVIKDPEPGDDLNTSDLADITVIKNKDSLKLLGLERFDGVTYLFTKAYRSRPDSIRLIPSSKQMIKKTGQWYFRDAVYSGRFIDYYLSGKKQGEGIIVDGRLIGIRRIYFQNGQFMAEKQFQDGLENGPSKEFYDDGSIRQKGIYANGKEQGIWEDYYPNGQLELRGNYKNGEITDSAYKYYSSGRIKDVVFI
jgi:antitoxin component YwqK of YwqJK toxin-antitoxin module